MSIRSLKIGFVGAGRMATALAAGFCRELIPASHVMAVDPDEATRQRFAATVGEGVLTMPDACEHLWDADQLFLAVKPQVMPEALAGIRDFTRDSQLFVSVAAGVTIASLEECLPPKARVIRVMPNTPCLIGRGACGLSPGRHATDDDVASVSTLLHTVGIVEQMPEKLLDAVTGLSGSGPAYVFQIIEALSDGGVKMGLPRNVATRLAAQTLAGAAEMLLQTGQHPGELKDAVTSPGGTTIAGLHELERSGLRAALMSAVEAATRKSRELGAAK
ncbi:MAG: pyrroline-5-carboxylate reductase [Planctomycetaceae bacterium]